jgi:hypothetical protein
MTRFLAPVVYLGYVAGGFLTVVICPPELTHRFLVYYPLASLAFGIPFTTFFTGHRSRLVDVAIGTAALVVGVLAGTGLLPGPALYVALAGALIASDYAAAQTESQSFLTASRALVVLSAPLLLVDFHLALAVRLAMAALSCLAASFFKNYQKRPTDSTGIRSKAAYAIGTNVVYFSTLASIPLLLAQDVKLAYVTFAIIGNIVLRMFDYEIKQRMSNENIMSRNSFALVTVALLVMIGTVALVRASPMLLLLAVPTLLLYGMRRLIENATWI